MVYQAGFSPLWMTQFASTETGLRAIRKRIAGAIARVANPADVRFVQRGVPLALLPVESGVATSARALP